MKKTIAAQVIAGDPFMFNVFINTFFDKWYHLVDRLYVQVYSWKKSNIETIYI